MEGFTGQSFIERQVLLDGNLRLKTLEARGFNKRGRGGWPLDRFMGSVTQGSSGAPGVVGFLMTAKLKTHEV